VGKRSSLRPEQVRPSGRILFWKACRGYGDVVSFFGPLLEALTAPAHGDDLRVTGKPIEDGSGSENVAEHLA
jgi:hypothetical protein